jgi:Fatty acid desaturase
MAYQMANPWTQTGRHIEIEKAVGEVYARYFARGPKWIAKHLPQRDEMREYGAFVSPETKEMLLGDFGVESFIEDYALWATYATGESPSSGQVYTQWVSDETRHSRALWFCLVDSGLYTQQQVDEYYHQCSEDHWTFERQTGHEPTPARGAAYAIAQERQTKRNYQSLQKRIWEEYGCPSDANGKPAYPAIAGVCRTLATDEGFHEGVFREITRIYLRFWPDKALQAMWDVYEKYRMPIVKLPNVEAFFETVLSTGIESPRAVITEVLNPTYAAMGLESRAAVKRAARESWDLPEGAVLQIGDECPDYVSEGAMPYRMNPDGSLVPVATGDGNRHGANRQAVKT